MQTGEGGQNSRSPQDQVNKLVCDDNDLLSRLFPRPDGGQSTAFPARRPMDATVVRCEDCEIRPTALLCRIHYRTDGMFTLVAQPAALMGLYACVGRNLETPALMLDTNSV